MGFASVVPMRVTLVALAVLASGSLFAGCGGQENAGAPTTATYVPKTGPDAGPPRALNPQPQAGPPRELFTNNCASCHALAAAKADGFVGPSLDEMRPSTARVLNAIRNGGARNEVMPSNLLVEEDARRVARYVARAAGK